MQNRTTENFPLTIGLDLGSTQTHCAIIGPDRKIIEQRKIATSRTGFTGLFERFPGALIVMEASTPARWINNLAMELGHETIVANPRKIPIITASISKCDRNDARLLAQFGQIQPDLLSPIQMREDKYQAVRTLLFARNQLVGARGRLTTFVRSQVKALGFNLPNCSTTSFASKVAPKLPKPLVESLIEILETIQRLSDSIKKYDAQAASDSETKFPQTKILRQVGGVGPLISLAIVATIGDPQRFAKSRQVGAYFGLVPKVSQSGKSNPDLRITKHGDRYTRSLLVSAATRILGPFGEDSDLRRFGLRIAAQGGKRSKAKARIAVARKLAVLLHALLRSGEVYEPLRNSEEVPVA